MVNLLETFFFPDIPFQPYPVHSISESGNVFNIRNIIYFNSGKSKKKYTRAKQLLGKRSQQARMFDFLINIGYWSPLSCIREFPVFIENSKRIGKGQPSFYLLDFYFPELSLAVELDSALHDDNSDRIRDKYLKDNLDIETFRIRNLEKPEVQKKKFLELTDLMKSMIPQQHPRVFDFMGDLRKLNEERNKTDLGLWNIKK